ncbi:MAG: hypothetical protein QOI40_4711 [Alphaproteobacteria bacterium]|jgi:hypothetical protein|nr:hypothetical protein [Alphaproteobacteria bacterium]
MHLIQLLLPVYDNAGNAFAEEIYLNVRRELADRFGGLTAFTRAPAQGLWKNAGETTHDDIMVFEVMTSHLDHGWWKRYRLALEELFRQEHIVIRAQPVVIL